MQARARVDGPRARPGENARRTMTPAEIIARVARALEALRDGDVELADAILDDLVWEFYRWPKEPAS